MADNLIFPIGFDLQKAVEEAGKDWDGKYAAKLEKLIQKRALNVRLAFNTKALDNLDDVKRRLAQLKIEPLTPENQRAIKDLVKELKELARIMERVQRFKGIELPELQMAKAAKLRKDVEQANEKLRLSQERVRQAEERLILSQKRAEQQAHRTGQAYRSQEGYISRLIKRLAVYAGFKQISTFLTSIREVTAQFELQRVSLGAIIQDQQRANQLFSEIKSFALKSPVSILDLTKYTKQLAAYKIGVNELFETTKKLTDVSVGLGVSMDRVVLAYGQTRATGYLRASEIRQFTEMGVPIVEELASKLSKMNGELVTAAQVMDMVSKRGISFELVKEVFDDMTSAGGIFYNMQEKQGNTLFGMWAKLGDAASVMYDEIGNTESVNKGMKAAIQALTDLMRNWQAVVRYMGYAGVAIAALITRKKILALEITKVDAIQRTYNTRMMRANALASANTRLLRAQGVAMGIYAKTMRTASTAAAAFGTSLTAIKGALISTGWGALVVALGYLADKLLFTKSTADKAAEALSKINSETAVEQGKSVRNFEYLAQKAVKAADGSREQKDALDELQRTYKDILPQELLELEYLNRLNGEYGSLTNTIRQYIAEQQRRKAIDEIANVYGTEKQKYAQELTGYFRKQGWSEREIARFWEKFYAIAGDKSKSLEQVVYQSMKFAGREGLDEVSKLIQNKDNILNEANKSSYKKTGLTIYGGVDYIDLLRDAVLEENKAIEQNEERTKAAESATNAFAEAQEKAANRIKNVRFFHANGESVDRDSYLGSQTLKNFEVKEITNILKDGFNQAGLAWDTEYGNFIANVNEKTPGLISSLNFSAITDALIEALKNPQLTEEQRQFLENLLSLAQQSKKRYDEIVPSDPVVRVAQTRFRQIAQSAGGFREQYNQYLMKAGEDMASYNKRLKGSLEDLKNKVKGMLDTQKLVAKAGFFAKMIYGVSAEELQKSIDDTNKTIEIIEKTISEQSDYSKDKDTKKSDPRLQNLKEEISLTKKLYDEYHKLEKQIGATKAAEKIQEIYKNTISTLEGRAEEYGFEFELPFTDENLKGNMQHFIDKMKELQGLKDKKGKPLFPNIGKEIDEAVAQLEDVDLNSLQKALEKKLKALADRISRTKTAKEFYEKILTQTGDVELSADVTFSIYGEDGKDLKEAIADQVRGLTNGLKLPDNIISADNSIDYKALQKWAKANETELGGMYAELIKISNDGQKELAKIAEQGAKLLLSYDEIAQERVNIEQEASEKIRQLREAEALYLASQATEEQKAAYSKRTNKAVQGIEAKRDLDLLKLNDEYMRFFSAIHSLTKKEAETLRGQVRQALFKAFQDGAISADELKRELKAIDEQFRKLTQDSGKFMDYLDGGFDGLINRLRTMADEMMSVGSEIGKMDSVDQISKGQKSFIDTMLKQFGNDATGNNFASLLSNTNGDLSKMGDLLQGISGEMGAMAEGGASALALVDRIITDVVRTIEGIAAIRDQLNEMRSEDNQLGGVFWDAFEYLENFNKYAAQGWEALKSGNIVGAVQNTIQSIISIFGTAQAQRVRKANKEIKKQEEVIERLQKAYDRLGKSMENAFGADYVSLFNRQIQALEAEAAAIQKKIDAEKSKGRKADKARIKEYQQEWADVMEQIRDSAGSLVEQMSGTTVADAARDFAKVWLETYASFSNTMDAMREKFKELIQNMVAESVMARVVQMVLQPVFDKMDDMYQKGESMESVISYAFEQMDSTVNTLDKAMRVAATRLESVGVDLKDIYASSSDYTGIKRDIASASEETMSSVASIGNTLMFYVSPLPGIGADVAAMRRILESKAPSVTETPTTTVGWTDWEQQAMEHYIAISRNTADMVTECRRAAIAAEDAVSQLKRVITNNPSSISYGIKVWA